MRIGLVGAGSWGTALAVLLAENGHNVDLWVRRSSLLNEIIRNNENTTYLPGIKFPENIFPSEKIEQAVMGKDVVVICVPTRAVRDIIQRIAPLLKDGAILVSATKGLEVNSFLTPSAIIKSLLPHGKKQRVAALSGPNHAEEVSRRIPTATVIAAEDKQTAELIQELFTSSSFRAYTNPDLIGVELAGAFKNVIAIAVGISDGLGFGDNTRATLITRGLVEISRLGIARGAQGETFSGLAGLGDLVATCTSRHSRNRYVGEQLGKGRTLEEIVSSMKMIAEGVETSRSVYNLAAEMKIDMPISNEVYCMLFENKSPLKGVESLMERAKTKEFNS